MTIEKEAGFPEKEARETAKIITSVSKSKIARDNFLIGARWGYNQKEEQTREWARKRLNEVQEAKHSFSHYYHYQTPADYENGLTILKELEAELAREIEKKLKEEAVKVKYPFAPSVDYIRRKEEETFK